MNKKQTGTKHGLSEPHADKTSAPELPFAEWRKREGRLQRAYGQRYGVSQEGGSRYENGLRPAPYLLRLLVALQRMRRISDEDLLAASRWVERQSKKKRA